MFVAIRSSLRALPRTIPHRAGPHFYRPLPHTTPPFRRYTFLPRFHSQFIVPPPLRQSKRPEHSSFILRRFQSQWNTPPPRRPRPQIHYNYDAEAARRARPLITTEQIWSTTRRLHTKVITIFAVGSGTIFYFSNLEEVPVSGRKRFNCYSDATVEAEGNRMYRMIMQEDQDRILPSWDRRSEMVVRVMDRLIPASGLTNVEWEVHVIDSPEINAFVIPGGKVFVYSGILPVAKNDDGLAAILGHEIAHNLARHAAERMSSLIMLAPIRWMFIFLDSTGSTMGLGRVLGDIALELGIARPASRKQESEADYIGLMMMAKSCYDPGEAVKVWKRMEKIESETIPEWLSTHPSHTSRIATMEKWLPKAEAERDESGCAVTLGYSKDFQSAISQFGGFGFR